MTNGSHSPRVAELQPAIEALAHETGIPIQEIEEVYCEEHSKLDAVARIKTYLPLITRNRVRDILKREYGAD